MDNSLDNLFEKDNIPESSWFKFEKVGDKVAGVVEDIYEKEGKDQFPDQKIFVLKTKDGTLTNVGVKKDNTYLIQMTNKVRRGDILGFEFTKEIPPSKKGYNPAKSITPYVKYTEEGNKQRELDMV